MEVLEKGAKFLHRIHYSPIHFQIKSLELQNWSQHPSKMQSMQNMRIFDLLEWKCEQLRFVSTN